MFDPTSRYAAVKTELYVRADGTKIPYKQRRFPPAPGSVGGEVAVRPNDRLDLIAARALGNPELFWRICDANFVLNPFELRLAPGRRLKIPGPTA